MTTSSSQLTSKPNPSLANNSFKIEKLPRIVLHEILSHFTFDEFSSLRLINQFFKKVIEKRLNDSFFRLGREINELSLMIKRRLPRKESERKDHPMNQYAQIVTGLESRYTILSMSYKKFIDANLVCFIPGKVLDLSYELLHKIRDYVKRDIYVELDVILELKDIRDYSTMSVEHFDLAIVPILTRRLQQPEFFRRPFEYSGRFCSPMLRSATFISNIYNFPSLSDYDREDSSTFPQINKISEQNAQNTEGKQIDDIQKLIYAQNDVIMNISDVLNEVSKVIPTRSTKLTTSLQKMTISATNLQGMLNQLSQPSKKSSFSQLSPEWLSRRIPESPESLTSTNSLPSTTSKSLTSPTTNRYDLRKRKLPSNIESKKRRKI